jgi:hypothetical protein
VYCASAFYIVLARSTQVVPVGTRTKRDLNSEEFADNKKGVENIHALFT